MNNFKLLTIATLIATAMYGCAGNTAENSSSEQNASESAEVTAEVATVSDPEAKSDSKGIGRFTSVEIGPIDKAMAAKGEAIFSSKCAACHKTTDEKIVGPGLKDITVRRTPEWIMNMITNPEEMTKKDPVGKALYEKHLVQMTFQNVSDEETRQILEFFRQNDIK